MSYCNNLSKMNKNNFYIKISKLMLRKQNYYHLLDECLLLTIKLNHSKNRSSYSISKTSTNNISVKQHLTCINHIITMHFQLHGFSFHNSTLWKPSKQENGLNFYTYVNKESSPKQQFYVILFFIGSPCYNLRCLSIDWKTKYSK